MHIHTLCNDIDAFDKTFKTCVLIFRKQRANNNYINNHNNNNSSCSCKILSQFLLKMGAIVLWSAKKQSLSPSQSLSLSYSHQSLSFCVVSKYYHQCWEFNKFIAIFLDYDIFQYLNERNSEKIKLLYRKFLLKFLWIYMYICVLKRSSIWCLNFTIH